MHPSKNKFTEEEIETARNYPIKWLLGKHTQQKMFQLKCPFHDDSTPSFSLYPNNSFHCFGCKSHGKNAIDFVMKLDPELKFFEAVEYLLRLRGK
jgi:DNA primase